MIPRVLSYGGGLDSFAMLLDAARRRDLPDAVVFCDVGDPLGEDPGEWPETYTHVRDVVVPLCGVLGVPFHWLRGDEYPVRGERSLFAWLWSRGQIPVAGPNRLCTTIAKVERFETWMSEAYPGREVEVWIGFEAGEESRAEKDPNAGGKGGKPRRRPGGPELVPATRRNRFPLIERGLCRCRCEDIVLAAGFPVPVKSACVYCPYGSKGDWQELQRRLPVQFDQTAELERRKPPTSKGKKLSIMGFRTLKNKAGEAVGYRAPPVAEFVKGTYRPRAKACVVCGRSVAVGKGRSCGSSAKEER